MLLRENIYQGGTYTLQYPFHVLMNLVIKQYLFDISK